MPQAVQVETSGEIRTLTLDTPHNRNALSKQLVDELLAGLSDAGQDSEVRAIVLTHTGGTFCAGADLSEAGGSVESRTQQMVTLLRAILETPKPVIGVLDGHVRAGGMGLVGACDAVFAGPASTFALSEVKLGLAPSIISLTVLPRITSRAAGRYLLTGEKFDSRVAENIGFITEASSDPREAARSLLDSLGAASPQGLRETKWILTAPILEQFDRHGETLAAQSARLFASEEAREGMMSFLEKRPPRWVKG